MNKYLALLLLNLKGIGRNTLNKFSTFKEFEITINYDDIMNKKFIYDTIKILNKKYKFSLNDIIIAQEKIKNIKDFCYKNKIGFIGVNDIQYPKQLLNIPDAPVFLFYKGNINATKNTNVAVIGTRKPTQDGSMIAKNIGKLLAEKKISVISGLAIGCDTEAHLGCLEGNGNTIAVMPCGLDNVYPKVNKSLAERILSNDGCLISEYLPKQRIFKNNFVERDRLQSGLSKGIIVIETSISSGTMHTVNFAKKQHRHLAVYKHEVKYDKNEQIQGNKKLISEGAFQIKNIMEDINKYVESLNTIDSYTKKSKEETVEINLFE